MADLFDRITTNPDDEEPTLSVHYLTSALGLVHAGAFTSTQLKNFFNMDVDASQDFDALVASLGALSTKADKLEFLRKLEDANNAIEIGAISTKTEYKNILGI